MQRSIIDQLVPNIVINITIISIFNQVAGVFIRHDFSGRLVVSILYKSISTSEQIGLFDLTRWKDARAKSLVSQYYNRIDNNLYDAEGDQWWQPDSSLYLLKTSINPVRVNYARKILFHEQNIGPQGRTALEVGCGGGILCEEIARMGFDTTGLDPSEQSLKIAIAHSQASRLKINYEIGAGEALPFRNNSYDVVFCCDVLEHVSDLPKVISEISRVLKPGGVLCYDTINRTFISKLVAINISQKWKWWAFMPPNLHVWQMFIKPDEIKSLLQQNNLEWKGHQGTEPNVSYREVLGYLHKRAKGTWTYKDLGDKLCLVESDAMSIMYMGYAVKSDALNSL
jgi:2-polyprenyl-6-hydroxyphenyl methylase/3-demethylubiquinone-9 3-methyltransferase